jgi:hypothetical protein
MALGSNQRNGESGSLSMAAASHASVSAIISQWRNINNGINNESNEENININSINE